MRIAGRNGGMKWRKHQLLPATASKSAAVFFFCLGVATSAPIPVGEIGQFLQPT
jgi:hypothetical protein